MPRISSRTLARLRVPLAVLLLALALPGRAGAQGCSPNCQTEEPMPDAAPTIGSSPGSMAVSQPTVTVTITGNDDYGVVDTSFHAYLNGVDVTGSFTFSKSYNAGAPLRASFTATGIVSVPLTGADTLTSVICDTATPRHCTPSQPAVYQRAVPGVEVSPTARSEPVSAGTHGLSFTVRNTGTVSAAFQLAAQCRDMQTWGQVACGAPASTAVLAPGAAQTVSVTYTVSGGQNLSATLTATQAGWRGQFARGTYASGTSAGLVSDCGAGQTTGCVQIRWPGERTTARTSSRAAPAPSRTGSAAWWTACATPAARCTCATATMTRRPAISRRRIRSGWRVG